MRDFTCSQCGRVCALPPAGHTGAAGYALDERKNKICYDCCAQNDKAWMREKGTISLYLTKDASGLWQACNWPGTLCFPVIGNRVSTSKAAAYGRYIPRTDAWFVFEGWVWHCVSKGDMDLARCRKTKERWINTGTAYGYKARRVR